MLAHVHSALETLSLWADHAEGSHAGRGQTRTCSRTYTPYKHTNTTQRCWMAGWFSKRPKGVSRSKVKSIWGQKQREGQHLHTWLWGGCVCIGKRNWLLYKCDHVYVLHVNVERWYVISAYGELANACVGILTLCTWICVCSEFDVVAGKQTLPPVKLSFPPITVVLVEHIDHLTLLEG